MRHTFIKPNLIRLLIRTLITSLLYFYFYDLMSWGLTWGQQTECSIYKALNHRTLITSLQDAHLLKPPLTAAAIPMG